MEKIDKQLALDIFEDAITDFWATVHGRITEEVEGEHLQQRYANSVDDLLTALVRNTI